MKRFSVFYRIFIGFFLGLTISSLVGTVSRVQVMDAKYRTYDTFRVHGELLRRGTRLIRGEVALLGERLVVVDPESFRTIYQDVLTSSENPSNKVGK